MQDKGTEELLKIWVENDRVQYTDEAFEAIKQLLSERKTSLPSQLSPRAEGIGEAQSGKKTKTWKKILCIVLVLVSLFFFALDFNVSFCREFILNGNPVLPNLIALVASLLVPLFIAFMVIWGASFLWEKWRIILGFGVLVWGIIYLREGLRGYHLNSECAGFVDPRALVEPKGNIGIGLFIMLVGFVILGFEIYRRFVKKGTPTISCGRGGGEGVNTA
jgi:hypothetical protein